MKAYKYMEVKQCTASLLITIKSLDDFSRFLDHHQYRQLFLLTDEENKISHFAVMHQGGLVQQQAEGFQNLDDYHAAVKAEFPNAATYYEALTFSCKNYKEYLAAQETGASDAERINKMKDAGFIEGFISFAEIKKTIPLAAAIPAVNASQLYDWAIAGSFTSFSEVKDALQKGFTEATAYRIAMEKGYANAEEFKQGEQGQYINAQEWKEAKRIKARNREDLAQYHELQVLGLPKLKEDEKTLLVLLSKLPQHKKVSANKLKELLQQQTETYHYTDTKQLPEWFAVAFTGNDAVINFLQKNEEAKKYGSYDTDGEYFETRRLQERKVIVDGSNVAYNSQRKNGAKPALANIIRMIEALKEKGFTEIMVMSDASLAHRITDADRMAELQQLAKYIQTPAEKPADLFLIDYVKINRCLLVSNDTFREWKLTDVWIAENIDFYRLSFVLSDDAVLLPDIDNEK